MKTRIFDLLAMVLFGYCLFNISDNGIVNVLKVYLVISTLICFAIATLIIFLVIVAKDKIDRKISKTISITHKLIWIVLCFISIYLSDALFFYSLFALIGLMVSGITISLLFEHNEKIEKTEKAEASILSIEKEMSELD